MKKTQPDRSKLNVSRQTIRHLDALVVKEVRGGAGAITVLAGGKGQCGPNGTTECHTAE